MSEMSNPVALYNARKRAAKQWAAQKQAVLDYKSVHSPEELCFFVMALDTKDEGHKTWLKEQIDAAFAEEVLDQVLDYDEDELTLRPWKHKGLNYRRDEDTHQVYHCDYDLNVGVYIEDCDTLDFYDDIHDQPGMDSEDSIE